MDRQDIIKRKQYQNKMIGNQEYSFEVSCFDPNYIKLRNFVIKNIKLLEDLNDYGMQFEYSEELSKNDEFTINVNIKWHMNLSFNNAKILALITKRSGNSSAATLDLFTDDEKYLKIIKADQQKNVNFATYKCPVCHKSRKDRKVLYAMILPSSDQIAFVGSECMKHFVPVQTIKKLESIIDKLGQISNGIHKVQDQTGETFDVRTIMQEKYDKTIRNENSKNNIRNMLLEKKDVRDAFIKSLRKQSNSIYSDYSDEQIKKQLDIFVKNNFLSRTLLSKVSFDDIFNYIKSSRKLGSSKNNLRSMLNLLPTDMLLKDKATINRYFMNSCKEYVVTNKEFLNEFTNRLIQLKENSKKNEQKNKQLNELENVDLYNELIKMINLNMYQLAQQNINIKFINQKYESQIVNECVFKDNKCLNQLSWNKELQFNLPPLSINKEELRNDIKLQNEEIINKELQATTNEIHQNIKVDYEPLSSAANLFSMKLFTNDEFNNYIKQIMKKYSLINMPLFNKYLLTDDDKKAINETLISPVSENNIKKYIQLNSLSSNFIKELVMDSKLSQIVSGDYNIDFNKYVIPDNHLLTDDNLKILKKNVAKLLNTKDDNEKIAILNRLNTVMFKYDYAKYSQQQMRFNPSFYYDKELNDYYQLFFKVNDNNIAHTSKWFNDELLNKNKRELTILFADYLFKKIKPIANKIIREKQENILNKLNDLTSLETPYQLFKLVVPRIVKSRVGILKTSFGQEA